ncbi:lipase, partial [Elysia marginata]
NIRDKQFQHFDYGERENLARYGQKTPPVYDPSKVKVPVAIFRGGNDWLADNQDVAWLLPQLNVTHDVYIPYYEHLDPIFAFDAVTLMYKDIINIIMGKN